jgi:hypothetical protein
MAMVCGLGFEARLAEPADSHAARGRKHRAKTDRSDARLLRELLAAGSCRRAGSTGGRARVARAGAVVRVMVNQRTVWCQRIHAELDAVVGGIRLRHIAHVGERGGVRHARRHDLNRSR